MKHPLFSGIIFILFGLTSCIQEQNTDPKIIDNFFDLEHFSGKQFKSENGSEINGANYKTKKFARSGEYSVELFKEKKQYALRYTYAPIELGDEVLVSVWRKKNKSNSGILNISTGKGKSYSIRKAIKTEGDWESLEKHIKINRELFDNQLNIYVWNPKSQKVYFDDLNIKIVKNGGYSLVDHPDLEQVDITISSKYFNNILIKREEALKLKVLLSNGDDWVKANINWDGETEKCKIRLKGDWTDHLIGQKWSFRINISGGKKINGLTRFSIQNPLSRNYLSEWFLHQILIDENVLTTRYDFINLKINNEIKGLFSMEEHFTDELLIAQSRSKGVIIKFDEGPMWQFRSEKHPKKEGKPIWYQSAEIIPFGTKNISTDNKLQQEFLKARDLLHRFQLSKDSIDQIFDIDKMAKFLALIDIFNAYHGLIWHNLRFYYNPESKRLEPIAYDLFTEYASEEDFNPGFMGLNFLTGVDKGIYFEFGILFTSKDFIDKYIEYLDKYTSPDFLDSQLNSNQLKINFYEEEIQKEYHFYHFDPSFYIDNARNIRDQLPEFKANSFNLLNQEIKNKKRIYSKKYSFEPVNNYTLKAYVSIRNSSAVLQFRNFYYKPIQITGYIVGTDTIYPNKKIYLNEYKYKDIIETKETSLEFLIDKVIYQVVNEDSLYIQNVIRNRAPH